MTQLSSRLYIEYSHTDNMSLSPMGFQVLLKVLPFWDRVSINRPNPWTSILFDRFPDTLYYGFLTKHINNLKSILLCNVLAFYEGKVGKI